jgi:SAM-dependent methyltransferase
MNIFETQSDFITRNLALTVNPHYNAEYLFKRYSAWVKPDELKGSKILDIGCMTGATAAYALSNGAIRYVGVDSEQYDTNIAVENLAKYYPNADTQIITATGEQYIKNCNEKFDIVFLGRLLHGIDNGIDFLRSVSRVADCVIIDGGTPLNSAADELKNILLKYQLTSEDSKKIEQIFEYIEYKQTYTEIIKSGIGDFLNMVYSVGFLETIFNQLGFEIDLSPQEELKQTFSDEYGYGALATLPINNRKKFVIKFKRVAESRPLSFAESKGYL